MQRKATLRVFRFDPAQDRRPVFRSYDVPLEPNMSILQALRYIYQELDPDLAFRDLFCKTNQCALCAMRINGVPAFACNTPCTDDAVIEPLYQYPVVRDLVVDFGCDQEAAPGNKPFKTHQGGLVRKV